MNFKFFALLFFSLSASAQINLLSLPGEQLATFDIPGGTGATPTAISPTGEVVGYYTNVSAAQTWSFIRMPSGEITTFTVPNSLLTVATGVNAAREVVGYYAFEDGTGDDQTYLQVGFRRTATGVFTSDYQIGTEGYPMGINATGQVVGYYLSEEEAWQSFIEQEGGEDWTEFNVTGDDPDNIGTRALAISDGGIVVGYYDNADQTPEHGFLEQMAEPATDSSAAIPTGPIVNFDFPNATDTIPSAVNLAGVIVGTSDQGGWLRQANGQMVGLGTPSLGEFFPVAINDVEEVAGACTGAAPADDPGATVTPTIGCLVSGTTYYQFAVPDAATTFPMAMNAAGAITGWWVDAYEGAIHGFVIQKVYFLTDPRGPVRLRLNGTDL